MSIEEMLGSINIDKVRRNVEQSNKKKETSVFESISLKDMREKQKKQSSYPRLLDHWLKKVPKSKLILDLGCGLGYTTMWLNSHKGQTIGVDADPVMIKQAGELHNYEHFYKDSYNRLNFKPNNFDVVFSYDSLKKAENIGTTLSEIYRVTKKYFFCVMPLYGLGLADVKLFNWQPSTIEEIKDLVSSIGFKVEEEEQVDILEKTGNMDSKCANQLVYIKGVK